ncbi:amino acid adenylation domain-containing protein [Acidiphilium acidophilum]|uniref:Amino acid adenylation domain-containing protein n=1 Tax=Acidiphilium acidophilum TaxID=76588 RepID=A0AAW9DR14_ACIAO|nr:amino acid adenylation domain-containing protein [Acidiphilium acidophilum]MDX5931649.1 amino acid adenylation domain-containing protein [Acidiphilium acidophilum]
MTVSDHYLPLTVAQRGLWIGQKIAPAGTIFNIAESIEIPGAIDPDRFIAALRAVAAETDTIRVRIVETKAGPRQIIRPDYTDEFPVFDVSGEADPRAAAEGWMWQELSAPVDLADGRLWMGALFKAGPQRWFWYHRAHHIMFDGFTGGLVARRVAETYTALVRGHEVPPCPFGSLDTLIAHDQAYRESPRFARDRAFWLEHLADLPPAMSLARRRVTGGGGLRRRTAHIDAAQTGAMRALAKSLGASLPQFLIALVAAYYHRVTGADDLVIGMPVTGRPSALLRSIPGMIANAAPMRLRFGAGMDFAALVGEAGRALLRALRHQQFRYEELRRDLGLFGADQQVSFLGVNIEPFDYVLDFAGHAAITHNLSNGSVEDMMIFIYDRSDERGLRIDFDANPVLYEDADLVRHETRLLRVIEQVMADPHAELARLDLFATGERALMLADWNATARPVPPGDVAAWIAARAVQTPDAVAVIAAEGALSYRDLMRQADDLAARLTSAGIGPGDLVALLVPRGIGVLAASLGIMRSGAAYLPLDPGLPEARRGMILADAKPSIVLTTTGLAGTLRADAPVLCLDAPDRAPQGIVASGTRVPRDTMTRVPRDTAYVIFTSGSTGRPKGVVIPKPALANLCHEFVQRLRLTPADRMLAVTTIGFDIAALELLVPLIAGAAVVLAPGDAARDPAKLAAMIRDRAVTAMQATPSLYRAVLHPHPDAFAGLTLLVGGEALPPPIATSLQRQAARLINVYGPTETTIWSTFHEMTEADCAAPPIGRAIANTTLYVLDQAGEPVPPCVAGELHIGGAGLAIGYLDRPDLTEARFIADRFGGSGSRLYRTGDIARFNESGVLEYLGRGDDQIKIRGFRVELGEVEAVLAGLPEVAAAAVALRDTRGQAQLVGYVVPQGVTWPDPAALRRRMGEILPDYMVPAAFVVLSTLPVNPNGKLDRNALPAPEAVRAASVSGEYVAPATHGEEVLAALWAETFGLDRVSVHDNFFALGGDSLTAARMVADLAGRFSADLPIGALFQDATIANLAPYLDEARASDPLAMMVTLRRGHAASALFCIHPVAGLSWGYAGLTRYLPESLAIHGLQSLGFSEPLPGSIEAIADHYIAIIRRVQPCGPYNLLGWSLGGLIAHAIAERLTAAGEVVKTLAMLDSYPFRTRSLPGDERAMVAASLGFLGYAPDRLGTGSDMEALVGLLIADYALDEIPMPAGLVRETVMRRVRHVAETTLTLAQRFVPGTIAGDLLFLRAGRRPALAADDFVEDDPNAWRRHVNGNLILHDIDCRHQDMLGAAALRDIGPIIARAFA